MKESQITEFWQEKYRKDAKKNWNLFYKRNETRFFKDRHWIQREFPELFSNTTQVVLEIGCGVGNFAFPLAEANPLLERIYACDFAPRAIELVQSNPRYNLGKITAFVADITEADCLSTHITLPSIDVATLIFVLSAIPPEKFTEALGNIKKVLRPNGLILFRDYAYEDAAQKRFKTDRQLSASLFVRQDGTLAYYFRKEEIESLFLTVGLECVFCEIIHGRTTNIKKEIDVDRLFIQAKFINKT